MLMGINVPNAEYRNGKGGTTIWIVKRLLVCTAVNALCSFLLAIIVMTETESPMAFVD